MKILSDKQIALTREQYLKVGSDYNIMTDMYEMKIGHGLEVKGNDYILSFIDRETYDMFIGYIYNQYLREI
jgi:hypothetical protein